MKKIAIALTALPLAFLGAGFAAGSLLIDVPAPTTQAGGDHGAAADAAPGHGESPDHGAATTAHGTGEAESHGAAEGDAPIKHVQASENGAPAADDHSLAKDRTLVRLGQMTVPVEKSNSVSYIVVDFALKTTDVELAQTYTRVEVAARLRDELLRAMHDAAETPVLRGVSIDSDALAEQIRTSISKQFDGIEQVLFVSLYKQDVPRS